MGVTEKIWEIWQTSGVEIPSFQSLYLRFKFGGTILATGTGFLVNTPLGIGLVTARHNVTGRDIRDGSLLHSKGGIPDRVEILHNGFSPFTTVAKTEMLLTKDGTPRWIEHPELGDLCDVVLIRLMDLKDVYSIYYDTSGRYPNVAVRPSDLVSVIGFPMSQTAGGMLAIWCSGYVASEPSLDYAGQPKFLIDCRTRKGQSGSPVVAYRTGSYNSPEGGLIVGGGPPVVRPLGVYTGRIHEDADIGEVWKWTIVEALVHHCATKTADEVQTAMKKFGKDSPEFDAFLAKNNLYFGIPS